MKHHDANPGSQLVCFAEIVCRDPFSIVGSPAQSGISSGRSRRQCGLRRSAKCRRRGCACRRICAQAGVDPERLDRVPDRSMAENLEALRQGTIEAAQLFEPVRRSRLLASQAGYLWHAASSRGRTTYTAFVTTRDRLTGDPEPLLRMVRAIFRTQQWIHAQSAAEIAAAIASFFPSARSWCAGRRDRPLPGPAGLGTRPGASRGRLRSPAARRWFRAVLSAGTSLTRHASTIPSPGRSLRAKPYDGRGRACSPTAPTASDRCAVAIERHRFLRSAKFHSSSSAINRQRGYKPQEFLHDDLFSMR